MFDVQAVVDSLSSVRPVGPWPTGAPARDYTRSPAAARVGQLAHRDRLFLFDHEQRTPLPLPDAWIESGQEEASVPPAWVDGQLPEPKYQSFRHDLMIGSFHPGHRGKWTTHELCHALVGFHWRRDATLFEHATAARLAELLPVVLYYFFDEAGLTRCPDHEGGGALYRTFCPRCEDAAAFGPVSREPIEDGLRYLDRELAAIARSRRLGRPIAHRFGSLDLTTDGLAYAQSHLLRLQSEAMERCPKPGNAESLDALEERVLAVCRAMLLGEPLQTRDEDWVQADLAFRMLTVREETEGEAAEAILELVERPPKQAYEGWVALCEDFTLPPAERVFAVGYDLGVPVYTPLHEGLQSACPLVVELLEDAGVPLTFSPPAERRPLGLRFADWLDAQVPDLAPLARLEALMRSVRADPLVDFPGLPLLSAAVLHAPYDVVALSEAVDAGSVQLQQGVLEPAPEPHPMCLLITRDRHGELVMCEVPPDLDLLQPHETLQDLGLQRAKAEG